MSPPSPGSKNATFFHSEFLSGLFFDPENGVGLQRTTICYIPEDGTIKIVDLRVQE
jgi:hypothetical protein